MTDGQREYQILFHTAALGFLQGYRRRAREGADSVPPSQDSFHELQGWRAADLWDRRDGGWEDDEDIEAFAQDEADNYAGDVAYGEDSDPQPDTPSLDVAGFMFQAGF